MKKKLLALGLTIVGIAAIVVFHSRMAGDFWPPDRSFVGPNLIASVIQWGFITIAVVLVWPIIQKSRAKEKAREERRWKELRERMDAHAAELEKIKTKL